MEGSFEYRGHHVSVATRVSAGGLHGWVCLLDESSLVVSSPDSLHEEPIAFIAAVAYACRHLDTLSDLPAVAAH